MKKSIQLLGILMGLFLCHSIYAQDLPEMTDYGKIIRNITYNDDSDEKLDLYLSYNADPNQPFVVLIHGGMYSGGDKSNMDEIARTLMANNISSVSVNYPLLTSSLFVSNTPYYVTMITDIWRAIQFCKAESVGWNIRSTDYTIIGNEAGGHIALLSAYKFYQDVESVVAVSPMTDFTDLRLIRNPRIKGSVNATKSFFAKILDNQTYESGIEPPTIYVDASPLYQFRNVPTLLIHGKFDDQIVYDQSRMLYNELVKYNVNAKLLSLEDFGSNIFYYPPSKQIVYSEIIKWLQSSRNTNI